MDRTEPPVTVIGVDAHKRTHTMVAVDAAGRRLGIKTVDATPAGHFTALRWARGEFGTALQWGVEDTRAMTAGLERDLIDAGQRVVRVPTQLMAWSRSIARERGKSDPIDALACARAVLSHPDLPVASHTPWSRDIKLLADRREDLLKHRTAMITRALWRVHELDPTHVLAPRSLIHRKNQEALTGWLAPQTGLLAEITRMELEDIARVTPEINALERRLATMVRAVAPSLLELYGCGDLTAARIIGETADVSRFRHEGAYASYAGLAPIPHWSGSTRGRHRAHRGGNRALNAAIHQIAMIQIMKRGPAGADYRRRVDVDSESHATAIRRLKRRIIRTVFTRLRADQHGQQLTHALAEIERRGDHWQERLRVIAPACTPPRRRDASVHAKTALLPLRTPELAELSSRNDEWASALGM